MRNLLAVPALLLLCGCQAAVIGGAGAAGWFASAQMFASDGDAVLAADAPVKRALCEVELKNPHGAVFEAGLQEYCANIPTTVLGATATMVLVLAAMKKAEK